MLTYIIQATILDLQGQVALAQGEIEAQKAFSAKCLEDIKDVKKQMTTQSMELSSLKERESTLAEQLKFAKQVCVVYVYVDVGHFCACMLLVTYI